MTGAHDGPRRDRLPSLREAAQSGAVLVALSAIAVTQPVLSVFGGSPETFVFAGADRSDVVWFALVVAVVPPVVVFGIEMLVGLLGSGARRRAHLTLVGLLGAAAIAQVAPWLLAVAAGVGLAAAYRRWAPVRQTLTYLALAPLLFVGTFLFVSPASDLVLDRAVTARSPVTSTTPIVAIVLDELPLSTLLGPDGTIDADLYPNIADLASTSTWYRNATTEHGLTLQAVPSVLSGQDPGFGDPPALYTEYPDNLFTLFGASHELNVSETITRLCPPSLCEADRADASDGALGALLERARQVWGDRIRGRHEIEDLTGQFAESVGTSTAAYDDEAEEVEVFEGEDGAAATPARLRDWLDGLDGLDGPSLSMIHLLLPHAPWNFLPSGHTYEPPNPEATGFVNAWPDEPDWPVDLGRQRHVLQTQYVDRLIGESMRRLDEAGLFDDAVVVLVADHGVNVVTAGNLRAAEPDSAEQIMWVPLIVKAPGQQEGEIDETDVRLVDVLPTIADLAGIDLPFEVDGVVAGDRGAAGPKTFNQMNKPPLMNVDQRLLEVDLEAGAETVFATRFRPDRDGPGELWPYRTGPEPRLIGTSTVGLPRAGDLGIEVRPDDGIVERLRDVDLARPSLPVFVSGTIQEHASPDRRLDR
ncbi:MAG: sulfatase-like hydrolase/transferase, partial [Actinomycetota bacterium]